MCIDSRSRMGIVLLMFAALQTPVVSGLAADQSGDTLAIDLSAADTAKDWIFTDRNASLDEATLRLDGRRRMTRAFFAPREYADVVLRAKFRVEPDSRGVLACGFMARVRDIRNYYYVHFDRTQAILVRHSDSNGWNEIHRASGLDKPAGEWHEGTLECRGSLLRVSLNGKLLFEARDTELDRGRVGFYGSQGLAQVKDIEIRGKSFDPPTALVVPPDSFGIVCDDGGAGGYEAFPDVCRLADGRLMCVFYAGYDHVSLPSDVLPRGGRIVRCLSSDEGRTWTPAETLYDGPDDDRDPSIAQLKNGTLLCNFFSLAPSDVPSIPYKGLGSRVVASRDGGKTWSPPRQIAKSAYCSSPIRETSSGRLILGLYAEEGKKAHGAVAYSDDGGVTWGPEVAIDNAGVQLDAETDLIELKDGRIFAAQRPQMAYSISSDRGATWTVSRPIGFEGHAPYLLRTRDDIILLAHRLPGTSLHYSLDECATWSGNVPIDDTIGAYPSLVNLNDGTVLVVYYEEGEGSNIRARRLRASRRGIEWLPWK